jgi:cytidine deaminase
MKEFELKSKVKEYAYEELNEADRQLIDAAKAATEKSYAPYSAFHVGAAVRLVDGTTVTGNNQENAAYPSGLCAERTTLFYANAQYPDVAVDTLAIAARTENGFLAEPVPPCGACRQVILECEHRYKHPVRILLYGTQGIYEVDSVGALLPFQFVAESMDF